MTNLTGNHGSLFSRTTATGLALLLFLSLLPACAARHMPDWSRVQAVPPKTKTDVQLYKDDAPQGSRKIQGRFDSATTDSLTLTLKDGQTHTLQKQAVRKVLTRRPFSKRWPGWAAMGITAAILEFFLAIDGQPSAVGRARVHAMFTFPIGAAFLYGSRMGGIYEVPPKHRKPLLPGNKQPDTGKKAPDKKNPW